MAEQQQALWHDTPEDAFRSVVEAMNPKEVSSRFWPEKPIADATKLLWHCLDPDRNEKLSLGQTMLILQWARKAGCHTAMHYIATESGYAEPQPVEPEDERAKLQREFIEAQKQMKELAQRMEKWNG